MIRSAVIGHRLLLAATLFIACSEEGDTSSGRGHPDGNADSGSGGTGGSGSVPEAAPDSNDASSYPIDPNGPPPDCILPCVWEVMKRCPGPAPGQACVLDTISRRGYVECCPMDGPAPAGPVLCGDESWVSGTVSSSVYKDGERCWWREGKASMLAGPPPTPLDWTSTWYTRGLGTGEDVRVATLEHANPTAPNGLRGQGTCYAGDEPVFTVYMDARADHCRPWYPECEVPGICPLPPDWAVTSDAGAVDATTSETDASRMPRDAASSSDATVDASRRD